MRICVVGGGLAGSLLAWRLAEAGAGRIDVALGAPTGRPAGTISGDATAASGGLVRGFEPDPVVSRAAVASLVELRASPTLRRWSDYREVGSLYVRDSPAVPRAQLAELDRALPGSAELLAADRLAALGWHGLPAYCTGVSERDAGYVSPGALRRAVLADLTGRRAASLLPVTVRAVRARPDGLVRCQAATTGRDYDLVAVAAGRWTGRLLRHSGLPPAGLRTKSDVERFESGLSAARAAAEPTAIRLLEDAVAVYRGDFLADLPGGGWIEARRADLRRPRPHCSPSASCCAPAVGPTGRRTRTAGWSASTACSRSPTASSCSATPTSASAAGRCASTRSWSTCWPPSLGWRRPRRPPRCTTGCAGSYRQAPRHATLQARQYAARHALRHAPRSAPRQVLYGRCYGRCYSRCYRRAPGLRMPAGSSAALAAARASANGCGRCRSYQRRWSRPTAW